MTSTPRWDDVRVFLAVARTGSLIEAADALRVSEATISRRLRALEDRLAVRLFNRLPNRVVLTPLGERLVAASITMEDGAAAFERGALAESGIADASVRVTATTSVALFVTRHLDAILAAAAGVRLQLLDTRATLNLSRREAEIALRMRRPPEAGNLSVRKIGRIAFTLYAAREYLDQQGMSRSVSLERLAFIALRHDRSSRQSCWLDRIAGEAPMRVRLDDVHLRVEAVRRGLGVTLLPCFVGDAEPSFCRLLAPPPELAEDVFLLVHQDLRNLPALAAVGLALVGLFRKEAAALLGNGTAAKGAVIIDRTDPSASKAKALERRLISAALDDP